MPNTPNSGYTPPPSRPRPLPVRAAGAQYRVVTHNSKPPNRRTFSGRVSPERTGCGAWSITFFLRPSKVCVGRHLGQKPGHGLIGQALKGLMHSNFQIGKAAGMLA